MIIFSNTTPLIALSSIRQLDLLPILFQEIHVVDAVIAECAAGGKIVVPDLTHLPWIRIVPSEPCDHNLLLMELDRGEQQTLYMASKMKADCVIIDEKLGRNVAEYMGLSVTGTLGVLLKAKQRGEIASFVACVQAMQRQGIRYNAHLLQRLALQVGETLPQR